MSLRGRGATSRLNFRVYTACVILAEWSRLAITCISRSVVFSSELTATMVLMSERIPCRYHLAVSAFHGTAPILTSFGRDCELHMLEVAEYGPGHHNRPSAKMRRHPSPQTCSSATRMRERSCERRARGRHNGPSSGASRKRLTAWKDSEGAVP